MKFYVSCSSLANRRKNPKFSNCIVSIATILCIHFWRLDVFPFSRWPTSSFIPLFLESLFFVEIRVYLFPKSYIILFPFLFLIGKVVRNSEGTWNIDHNEDFVTKRHVFISIIVPMFYSFPCSPILERDWVLYHIEDSKAKDMCNSCFWIKEVVFSYATLRHPPVIRTLILGSKSSSMVVILVCSSLDIMVYTVKHLDEDIL